MPQGFAHLFIPRAAFHIPFIHSFLKVKAKIHLYALQDGYGMQEN